MVCVGATEARGTPARARRARPLWLLGAAIWGLAGVAAPAWSAMPEAADSPGTRGLRLLGEIEAGITDLAARVSPSVVSLSPPAGGLAKDRFRGSRGNGSGVIIDEQGYIATNNHVIGDAETVEVRLFDGTTYTAEVIGRDPDTDLALVKIEAGRALPAAPFGDSMAVKVGQWALAVGNPFGLERTVTLGVVSGVGRDNINLSRYENYIQTDSSIFPGNSGGPLFNLRGEVIGINTAVINSVQGIGFAIPADMAKRVLEQLRTRGKVLRGWLGVGIQRITAELGKKFGVSEGQGVLVNEVFENDPAALGGIRPGDVITRVDGTPVDTPKSLSLAISRLKPGDIASIEVIRDQRRVQLEVSVTERQDGRVVASLPGPALEGAKLGLHVEDLTAEVVERMKLSDATGVLVSRVDDGSLAQAEGLRAGDVIKEFNRRDVSSALEFSSALTQVKPGETVLLRILRESRAFYVVLRKTSR